MITGPSRHEVLQQLSELEIDYWFDVDFNWGRTAHNMYVQDCVFAIGDHRMEGRDAVEKFYSWRRERGARVARHIATNFRLNSMGDKSAKFQCILILHAADGSPVLPSAPPIMIADILSECGLDAGGRWLYRSHLLVPVFMGGEAPTIPTPQPK